MKESVGVPEEDPQQDKQQVLALLLGLVLIFLHFWSRQEFLPLIANISPPSSPRLPVAFESTLVLLLSIGLSPVFSLLGLFSIVYGLRPDLPTRLRDWVRNPTPHGPPAEDLSQSGIPDSPAPVSASTRSGLHNLTRWLEVRQDQLVFLALSLAFAVAAALAAGDADRMAFPLISILSWFLAIIFALAGGWISQERGERAGWPRAVMIGGFLALSVLALIPRAWNTARFPIVLTGDEGSVGLEGIRFLTGQMDNIFRTGWFSFPNLYYFLQGISIGLFGRTAEALRLTSAVAGALTAGAVFIIGQALFNRRAGILAAFILAVFSYHIHFSRLGLNNVWDGLMFTLTLGLLWVGWQYERRAAFLASGLFLGLAQYFYLTSRLLWLIIPAWVLLAGLLERTRLRRSLPGVALTGWMALVTVLPLAAFYLRHPADFFWPLQRVADLSTGSSLLQSAVPAGELELAAQLRLGLAAYLWEPLQFVWYNPGTPILRALPATLFLLGALFLFLRRFDSRALLLALWLLAIGLAAGLSDYTPAAQRYVAAAPACTLVIAAGADWLLDGLTDAWPRWPWATLGIVGILLLWLAVDELGFYFVEYAPYSALGGSDTLVANQLAEDLQSRPAGWKVAFLGGDRMGYGSIRSLEFLLPQVEGVDIRSPWAAAGHPELPESELSFVFLPGEEANLPAVQQAYPGGDLKVARDFEGTLLYWRYDVLSDKWGIAP